MAQLAMAKAVLAKAVPPKVVLANARFAMRARRSRDYGHSSRAAAVLVLEAVAMAISLGRRFGRFRASDS